MLLNFSFDAAIPMFPYWCPKPRLLPAPESIYPNSKFVCECCCIASPLADIRWQDRTSSEEEWRNVTGISTEDVSASAIRYSRLSFNATYSIFLHQFRCICNNSYGEAISDATLLLFPSKQLQCFYTAIRWPIEIFYYQYYSNEQNEKLLKWNLTNVNIFIYKTLPLV